MINLKEVLPESIFKQLEAQGLVEVLYDAIAQDIKAEENANKMNRSFSKYKPDMSVITDGTYRRTIKAKLGVSGREFVMVEPNLEDKQYRTRTEMLADCILTIQRDKNDPKYKEEPIIDFTAEEYQVAPELKVRYIEQLGQGEAAPLYYVLGYFGYLQEEFFRTW